MYDKFIRYQLEALTLAKSDYSEYRRELKTEDIVDDILDDAKNNVNKTISRVFEEFSGFGGVSFIKCNLKILYRPQKIIQFYFVTYQWSKLTRLESSKCFY